MSLHLEPDFDDDKYCKLSDKKFINLSKFKGKKYLNIREYVLNDGKLIPTKKGITLTADEVNIIVNNIDEIKKWF